MMIRTFTTSSRTAGTHFVSRRGTSTVSILPYILSLSVQWSVVGLSCEEKEDFHNI